MKIPERTVDSMVAIEISRLVPTAIISSPTNTRGAADHLIKHRFAVTVLECKGVDDGGNVPIRLGQLWEYAFGSGPRATVYLLPSRPDGRVSPWVRRCDRSCCARVGCRYCPRDERSWTGLEEWVRRLDLVDRLQPWFSHWSWCVPCVDLAGYLGIKAHTKPHARATLSWDDNVLGALPRATRLCHYFGSLSKVGLPSLAITSAEDFQLDVDTLATLEDVVDDAGTPPLVILQPPAFGIVPPQ